MLWNRISIHSLRSNPLVALFFVTMIAVFPLSAFGGTVSVQVEPATASIVGTSTITLDATVTNDVDAKGVTWTVTGGGTLSNQTKTEVTYTPPAVTSKLTVTVTATSVADPTKSGSAKITVVPGQLQFITTSLPAAAVGKAYTATLTATGGTPPYKFALKGGSLTACLTVSAAGEITGTPNASCVSTQVPSFTVTDSSPTTASSATMSLMIVAAPAIVLPSSLPSATYNVPYSGSAAATGGAGTLTYSVLSQALPTGLSLGADGLITGKPTVASNFTFDIKAADAFGDSAVKQYSIKVNYTALTVTVKSLPNGYVGSSYPSTQLAATGGSGLNYRWALANGTLLPAGLTLSNLGVISGKPTGAPGTTNFTVKATDSALNTGTGNFSIVVDAAAGTKVSGQISNLNNWCGNGQVPSYPAIKVSINTTPVQSTTADIHSGNFSFSNVPAGKYTITPALSTLSGATAVFYPASESVTVSGSSVKAGNFSFSLGMTVSGAVSYAGTKTGQTYIWLTSNNCGGNGGVNGTSITHGTLTSGGDFSIRGVPPGNYTIDAGMDTLGQGSANASDPFGSASISVPTTASVTGADITMTDPTVTTPTSGPQIDSITPTNLGVVIFSSPITSSNGEEAVTGYTVEWSTKSTFASTTSHAETAAGKDSPFWILNTGMPGLSSAFVNGTGYYFRARGELAGGTVHTPWTVYGGSTPTKVTVGPPSSTGKFTVTGTVTIPSTITPKGPLYVSFVDPNTGSAYGTSIAAPSNASPNAYTVHVPDVAATYYFIGILDQNNDGQVDVGDITNMHDAGHNSAQPFVIITASTPDVDITLPKIPATSYAGVQYYQDITSNGTINYYNL